MSEHVPYFEGINRHKTVLLFIPPIKRNAMLIVSRYFFLAKGCPVPLASRRRKTPNDGILERHKT